MSLASKLLTAQINVEEAAKNCRNEHHKFNYASADSVAAIAKTALNAAGLLLVNTGWKLNTTPTVLHDDPNRPEYVANTAIIATFVLIDPESDERLELTSELPFVPVKGRPEDKAALASLTEMRGYVALGLLGIERVDAGDLPDVSGRDDTYQQGQRRQEPPRQQQQHRGGEHGTCKDCGAEMKISKNTGKPYCGAMCWKNQPAQNGNGRDY